MKDTLLVPKIRRWQSGSGTGSTEYKSALEWKAATPQTHIPKLHVQEPTEILSEDHQELATANPDLELISGPGYSSPKNGVRLHKMDISEQLRCMSELSNVAEDEVYVASPHPWNFHHRERSEFEASGRSRHSREMSSTGVDSASVPSAWGRVRTPIRDTSSSIYSRPTSAGPNPLDRPCSTIPDQGQMEQIVDLTTLFADWPLKPFQSTEEVNRKLSVVSQKSAASEHRDKPLPPTPNGSRQQSSVRSFVTAADNNDSTSIKWLSPQQRSILNEDTSSILTKASKASRFFEKLSPPKKLVRKRRSIFKFLRPGSRKQQGRSISTPTLSAKSPGSRSTYDGPSDDPALLTVQYELTDQPSHATRSMSMSHLGQVQHTDTSNQLLSPHPLQRRPTMAEYERKLSVAGDDRRRPSMVNPQRMMEIHEEDHGESVGLRRKLSRAHALKDDASPLMAQALEKHHQEKALFRSASKQRESLKSAHSGSLLGSPGAAQEGSVLNANSIDEREETLHPLSTPDTAHSTRKSRSSAGLAPPQHSVASSSRRASAVGVAATPSFKSAPSQGILQSSQTQKPRIGTSLNSWSRYPSHTRAERCGPAGRADLVLTRDFAVDINPADIHVADETEPSSPVSKRSEKVRSKKRRASLPKSRSMTFSSIVRYYSNIFHSSSGTGQNRRTSVSTGGRLDYPELEMLPPPSVEATSHHHHSHWDPFEGLKEDAHKIKEYVVEEEEKIEGYVRQEEDKFEHFVRDEEDKIEGFVRKEEDELEGFVKKEEQKLMTYVKEEEGKLMHHRHHSASHLSSGRNSPFKEASVFGASHEHGQYHTLRRDTMIGPTDDVDDPLRPIENSKNLEIGMALDGTQSVTTEKTTKSTSKADQWSGVYKEYILEPNSTESSAATNSGHDSVEPTTAATTMAPPALKPVKPRSPEQPKQLDPTATIRRFPSVTVVDDCKGHFRSVSLISVKTNKSNKCERSSTHDLLELIQAREREERDKLLKSVRITVSTEAIDLN